MNAPDFNGRRAAQLVRQACASLTDRQRIAVAITLINDVEDPGCAQDALRLSRVAKCIGDELDRESFIARNLP